MADVIDALNKNPQRRHLVPPGLPDVKKHVGKGILTPAEIESLAVLLEILHDEGLGADSSWHLATQNVKGGNHKGLQELKVPNTTHNPRLMFVVKGNQVIFVTAFTKKKMKLDATEKDTARTRRNSLTKRGLWP